MDLNSDGVIDYTEFVAAASDMRSTLTESNLKQSFKQFDVNGSGYVEIENLKKILGVVEEKSQVDDILQMIDFEDKTKMNFSEFKQIMMMLVKKHSESISNAFKKQSSVLDIGLLMQADPVPKYITNRCKFSIS